jgi:hypothetical protein
MALSTKVLVQRLLAKVLSKPGVDIFMRKDIKNFLYNYGKQLKASNPACDSCCPVINETGATVTETVLTFNGSTLSTTGTGASGFEISPTTTANKRLYGVVIEITGADTETFSVYNSLTELSESLSNSVPNIIGITLADNDPVPEEAIEAILTISSDSNESANDLSAITVTVKLYTA